MNKIKIIIVCLLVPFFVLVALTFLKIKNKEELQQKAVLAQETRKALTTLMFDIYQARKGSFEGLPADGLWHNHVAFFLTRQGTLEYRVNEGRLFRINNGKISLIADNIDALRIRRLKETPDILEVQVEAHKNVSLLTNLKIRVRQ